MTRYMYVWIRMNALVWFGYMETLIKILTGVNFALFDVQLLDEMAPYSSLLFRLYKDVAPFLLTS